LRLYQLSTTQGAKNEYSFSSYIPVVGIDRREIPPFASEGGATTFLSSLCGASKGFAYVSKLAGG